MKIFRDRLRTAVDELCNAEGITQEQLAHRLGLDRNRFRNYFTRATNMPLEQLRLIGDKMHLDFNWLMGRDASPEWPKNDPLEVINRKLDQALKKDD